MHLAFQGMAHVAERVFDARSPVYSSSSSRKQRMALIASFEAPTNQTLPVRAQIFAHRARSAQMAENVDDFIAGWASGAVA
eukprot:6214110-Pleurochrysis_carterae.AAC.15